MPLQLWINGKWAPARDGQTYSVIDPATGAVVDEVSDAGPDDVNAAISAADRAFSDGRWSDLGVAERSQRLWEFAKLIEQASTDLIRWECLAAGKPIKLVTYSDIPFAVDNLRFFAAAARFLDGAAAGEYNGYHTSWLRREPIGVVAGITPWNYPLMIAIWKIAPALAAGNTMVLKPAPQTPITSLLLGPLASQAGIPDGVLNIVVGQRAQVGQAIVKDPRVRMISFTGSTVTGRSVMQTASTTLKRLHLELGGKAPAIVRQDADLEEAANGIAVGALVNTGQDCTAVTRVYVSRPLYQPLLERLKARFESARLGSPLDMTTDLGPLISAQHQQKVQRYVSQARESGARVVTGGDTTTLGGSGFYFQPTLLTDVHQDWPVVQEEIFGPVLVMLPFDRDDEALRMANDVSYGLASSVWTKDFAAATRMSRQLEFGEVWINEHLPLTSEMPHGGVKQSGFGHDLSAASFNEYTVLKHVMTDPSGEVTKGWHFTVLGDPPEDS